MNYKLVADLSLVFARSSGLSLLIDWILWSFNQSRSDPKAIPSGSKKNMLIAKEHKRILSREVRFWTGIWSDQGDGFKAGSEVWDDGNISSNDGSKGKCSDRSQSLYPYFNQMIYKCLNIFKNILKTPNLWFW